MVHLSLNLVGSEHQPLQIANARAEAKAYKQAQTLVNKQVKEVIKRYYDMTLEFDEKADFIQRHDAEYVAEISN